MVGTNTYLVSITQGGRHFGAPTLGNGHLNLNGKNFYIWCNRFSAKISSIFYEIFTEKHILPGIGKKNFQGRGNASIRIGIHLYIHGLPIPNPTKPAGDPPMGGQIVFIPFGFWPLAKNKNKKKKMKNKKLK